MTHNLGFLWGLVRMPSKTIMKRSKTLLNCFTGKHFWGSKNRGRKRIQDTIEKVQVESDIDLTHVLKRTESLSRALSQPAVVRDQE